MPKILSIDTKHEKASKQNLFRLIWEWFLLLDRLSKLFLITIAFITVATPSIVTMYLVFNPKAAIVFSIGTSYSVVPSSGKAISPKSLVSESGITGVQSYTVDSEIISLLNLLNNYRAQNGLSVLIPSFTLTEIAKWISNDMANKNYFSHTDSLGRDPSQRMIAFGYTYNTWKGENLAAGFQTGYETLEAWKGSPGHNANLLNPNYTAVGLYRAYNSSSTFGWYWAQELGGTLDAEVSYMAPAQTASITLSHNPCLVISGTSCTSTVTWSTSGYPSAYICTSNSSNESFFASGNSGSKQITFPIGKSYQFIMRTPSITPCGSGSIIKSVNVLFSTGGDVNCDGSITSVDALLVQRYVAKLSITGTKCSTGSNTINQSQADVDKDGDIDAVDSLLILKYVAS